MNNHEDRLAIVIPAYKRIFFNQTLESLARQTCKNFIVYIGDDASPENLQTLTDSYKSKMALVYNRFESNLGKSDLVAHWKRCVDLVQNEEWIWFFSDDDVASPDCVEGFFETLKFYKGRTLEDKVFRFTLNITDKDLNLIHKYITPKIFSVEYFLENYFISHTFTNRAVEFVFSKYLYNKIGGFVNFPLAWGSDLATFLKLGHENGFVTIHKGEVYWRSSSKNISSNNDYNIAKLKQTAYNQRYLWIFGFLQNFSEGKFYYSILYRTLHYISLKQALSKLKEEKIKSFCNRSIIILLSIFISLKKMIGYRIIKRKIKKILGGLGSFKRELNKFSY